LEKAAFGKICQKLLLDKIVAAWYNIYSERERMLTLSWWEGEDKERFDSF
jgi:hypothetical protein